MGIRQINKNQTGAALITVMIVVFIMMAIIAHLTVTNFRTIKRLGNRQLVEQASTIAFSAIDFGRAGLGTSASTSQVDTLKDIWAQPIPKVKLFDDVYMSGNVIDEQSKFNLNDLVNRYGQVNPNVLKQFTNLLTYINLSPDLATAIAYYMAAPQYQGSISTQYSMSNPPSRPAGRPLVDITELMLVKGMDANTLQRMLKYVTVIPVSNFGFASESSVESQPQNNDTSLSFGNGMQVNVNTAMPEVIAAKAGMPVNVAQRMISERQAKSFGSQSDVVTFLAKNGIMNEKDGPNANKYNLSGLGVTSNYFTIHAVVDDQQDQVKWVALVYRQNRSGQWPQILWRHPE